MIDGHGPLPGPAIRFLVTGTTGALSLDIQLTGELTLERDVTVDDIPQSDVPDALNILRLAVTVTPPAIGLL